jgi:hypothetical protein
MKEPTKIGFDVVKRTLTKEEVNLVSLYHRSVISKLKASRNHDFETFIRELPMANHEDIEKQSIMFFNNELQSGLIMRVATPNATVRRFNGSLDD